MKNIDKKSQSRQNDDTWLYLLLLLLVALLVGGGVWWYIESQKEPELNYNYKEELGEFTTTPTAKETSQLISGNRNRYKTVKRILEGKMKGANLSSNEKRKLKEELDQINFNELDKRLQNFEMTDLEKNHPDILANVFQESYELGKILTRLKVKVSDSQTYEEVVKQVKFQNEWEISAAEVEEINAKMNEWITKWYNQAKEEVLERGGYKLLTGTHFEPVLIEGRPANINSSEDWNWFKKIENGKGKGNWEEFVANFKRPLEIVFEGYGGFITPQDLKNSSEAESCFGLTLANGYGEQGWGKGGGKTSTRWKGFSDNQRKIVIKLKKEFFLSRLGYEKLITNFEKKDGSCSSSYFDICFDSVAETIAHELAHALINSIKVNYDGQEGGGHGSLFYDFMEQVEAMMRKTPEFNELEEWWDLTKK